MFGPARATSTSISRSRGRARAWIPAATAATAATAALLLTLTGCTPTPAPAGTAPSAAAPAATAAAPFDPADPLLTGLTDLPRSEAIGLAGLWQVYGAEGEEPGAYVGIWVGPDGASANVYRFCGSLGYSLAASESALVAQLTSGHGYCFDSAVIPSADPHAVWLEESTGYRAVGDGWELLDASGAVAATLVPAVGLPTVPPDIGAEVTELPRAIEPDRVVAPAPLAAGLEAASASDLVGTWAPVGAAADRAALGGRAGASSVPSVGAMGGLPAVDVPADDDRATLTFDATGHYRIDDCVGEGFEPADDGAPRNTLVWAGDGEEFLAPGSAFWPDIGCAPRWPGWETATRTIALDNGYLRLFAADGTELIRLEPVG